MMKSEAMQVTQQDDAELVAECLDGNQDAFRKIVERYQTLVCSVAYCATGSVSCSSFSFSQMIASKPRHDVSLGVTPQVSSCSSIAAVGASPGFAPEFRHAPAGR